MTFDSNFAPSSPNLIADLLQCVDILDQSG